MVKSNSLDASCPDVHLSNSSFFWGCHTPSSGWWARATPLKNMSASIGMMIIPKINGKMPKKMATKPPTSPVLVAASCWRPSSAGSHRKKTVPEGPAKRCAAKTRLSGHRPRRIDGYASLKTEEAGLSFQPYTEEQRSWSVQHGLWYHSHGFVYIPIEIICIYIYMCAICIYRGWGQSAVDKDNNTCLQCGCSTYRGFLLQKKMHVYGL